MIRNILNPDNSVMRALNRLADLMILNLTFLICCLPIVTIGASLTALYTISLKIASNEEGYIFKPFLKAFRDNFRQSTVIWLGVMLVGALLGTDIYILNYATGGLAPFLRVFTWASALLYCMVVLYIFPVLARFDNTIRATIKNAFIFSIVFIPRTLIMLVLTGGAVVITLWNGYTLWYGILFWLLVGFSGIALINSKLFNRIFARFIPDKQ